MRCYCCNNILTTQEATRKFKLSGEFTDMCDQCLNEIVDDTKYMETLDGESGDEDLVDDEGNLRDE
jgi:hypothetical protein